MNDDIPILTVSTTEKNPSGWGFQAKKKKVYVLEDIYTPLNPFNKYFKKEKTIQWVLENDPLELQNFLYRNSANATANDAMKKLIYPWHKERREFEDDEVAFILWKGNHFPKNDIIIKWDDLAKVEINLNQRKTTLWQHINIYGNSNRLISLHKLNQAHLSKKLLMLIECETVDDRINLLRSFK
ncbi:hypothetical protein [Mangrovimonas futianensis]|uniref:hypothetical protein n=1 Tax=Mangrovimonas futianensis TaxID=2895523 RepID=UPI001E6023F9|nr:hypothetical protein [Mangrovimonas futianensis]MCF1420444.1 hypothetical protein [Mangrovimonas futianensis]